MSTSMVNALEAWATDVFTAAGMRHDDARQVAAGLAFAEQRGVSSHGFVRTKIYLDRLQAGGINPRHELTIVSDRGGLVILDADNGPGAATAYAAALLAIERARHHGTGCVIARNAGHFGAAGYFTNLIADTGMIGLAACNTDKIMCPPYGGRAVLGSNPLAVAVPLPAGSRPQLDMATTEASLGKILVAHQNQATIPSGWAVDADGTPTTDPAQALDGALLPAAGPKGFGLAFIIDSLVALSGAATSPDVAPMYGDPSVPQRLGHFFLAIDVGDEKAAYQARVSRLAAAVHDSGTPDNPRPLFPGEPELASITAGNDTLPPRLHDELAALGERFKVPFPIPSPDPLFIRDSDE